MFCLAFYKVCKLKCTISVVKKLNCLFILTFLTARPCESSWAATTPRLMVTGHPSLALTPLGTGSTIGPWEASWRPHTHARTQTHNSLLSCRKILYLPVSVHSLSISSVLYALTFVALGSSPAWLTVTAARHMVATRAMGTVTSPLAALTKESLRTGFKQNTHKCSACSITL